MTDTKRKQYNRFRRLVRERIALNKKLRINETWTEAAAKIRELLAELKQLKHK